jgi:hypothetical protein
MDAFKSSVRQADIMSNNPFEVGVVGEIVATPRKERGTVDEKIQGEGGKSAEMVQ